MSIKLLNSHNTKCISSSKNITHHYTTKHTTDPLQSNLTNHPQT
jgi:hypothetical protein